MGVPVAPRNIFPSNIQGLPTWYEVRVSEAGHLGRRGGVDLMVAMNPQTWDKDVAEIEPGGYLFYDFDQAAAAVEVPRRHHRHRRAADRDLQRANTPIRASASCSRTSSMSARCRRCSTSTSAVIEKLIGEQFKGKDKLIAANVQALHMGRDYALREPAMPDRPAACSRADKVGDRIFIEGNDAAALGAVYGGATVCAWYPITPSTSLAEAFTSYCQQLPHRSGDRQGALRHRPGRGRDRLDRHGDRRRLERRARLHRTSGPGISLMQEFIGLAYFAEIPAVIFDVQRGGPSTGMPTRTQQCRLISCAYASHGDTKHVLLFPEDPPECFEFGALAFDLADRLQTPIFVMLDLDIGMNDWLCRAASPGTTAAQLDRGKVMTAEELEAGKEFGRYLDVDGDGIPYRTYPGTHPTKGAYLHPRHLARPLRALHRGRRGLRRQHAAAAAQVRDRQGRWCPRPVRAQRATSRRSTA